jgi:hypothetical protein
MPGNLSQPFCKTETGGLVLHDLRSEIITELVQLVKPDLPFITEVFTSNTGRQMAGIRLATCEGRTLVLSIGGDFWVLHYQYFRRPVDLDYFSIEEVATGLKNALTNVEEKRRKLERVLAILREQT